MNPANPACELSIVVGSLDAAALLHECGAALAAACRGLDAEILIVEATDPAAAERARERVPIARVLPMPRGTLVPALWGHGLSEARGRVVAFTIAHCVVAEGWARSLLAAIASGAAGAGGPLALRAGVAATGRATYYLRYSAWLGLPAGPAREIPGDNAAYDHAALRAVRAQSGDAFWEVEAHAKLRALGRTLLVHPEAIAWFGDDTPLTAMAARRFQHGRHSGAFRVREGVRTRWQVVLAAPLVPFVLLSRVARRVARAPGHATSFATSLGAFLVLAGAWAAGEAVGAFMTEPARREALRVA
jgi:hypothetical protein